MGDLCDQQLLCPKGQLYRTVGGGIVEGHLNTCVTGHCPVCQKKQRKFFDCPRHRTRGQEGRELKWEVFAPVDENGDEIRPSLGGQQPSTASTQGAGDGSDEWEPQRTNTGVPRKVNVIARARGY